jgi:hypothetical protein
VITEFNLQYELLYARADLSLIPSCEIGFARDDIHDAYIAYMNRGEVCDLAAVSGAGFLVEKRTSYLDPDAAECMRLQSDDGVLRIWTLGSAK